MEAEAATAFAFIDAFDWNEVVQYSKQRREAVLDGLTVVVDRVEGGGTVAEIEAVTQTQQLVDAAELRLDGAAEKLGLLPEWVEPRKYDELATRR